GAARMLRTRQGVPLRADRRGGDARARDLRVRRHGHGRFGRVLPRPPRARRPPLGVTLPSPCPTPAVAGFHLQTTLMLNVCDTSVAVSCTVVGAVRRSRFGCCLTDVLPASA